MTFLTLLADYTIANSTADVILGGFIAIGAAVVGWTIRNLLETTRVVSTLQQQVKDMEADHDRRLSVIERLLDPKRHTS